MHLSNQLLKTSKDADFTPFVGSLLQCLFILLVNKFVLIAKVDFPLLQSEPTFYSSLPYVYKKKKSVPILFITVLQVFEKLSKSPHPLPPHTGEEKTDEVILVLSACPLKLFPRLLIICLAVH